MEKWKVEKWKHGNMKTEKMWTPYQTLQHFDCFKEGRSLTRVKLKFNNGLHTKFYDLSIV